MKIALATHTARRSGAEIALLDLAEALRTRGVDASLLLLEDGPVVDDAASRSVPVTVVEISERVRDSRRHKTASSAASVLPETLAAARLIRRAVTGEGFDVVHTNTLKSHLLCGVACLGSKPKCLWHLRDIIAPPHVSSAEARLLRVGCRYLAGRAVAISDAAAAPMRGLVSAVVPTGIRTDHFGRIPDVSKERPDVLELTMVSRIAPWKGQHIVLAAVRGLQEQGLPYRLRLVGAALFGESRYLRTITADAQGLNCSFDGHVDDVATVLRATHLFVHAAVFPEPLGKVIVEALAAGRPTLASAAGGPLEVLTGEFAGWLVPPGDARTLAARMAQLWADWPRTSELASQGRGLASRFDVAVVASGLIPHYEDMVGRCA